MRELSLHILDIAENSISAHADQIKINVTEALTRDQLWISVRDNGDGMDAERVSQVIDPFVTTRTTRKVGLGIPLLKQAAEACEGWLKIDSEVGKGTHMIAMFGYSHIDRMPLGDLAGTMLTLELGSPEINFIFRYQVGKNVFFVDDKALKEILEGVPMTSPCVLSYLSEYFRTGIEEIICPIP